MVQVRWFCRLATILALLLPHLNTLDGHPAVIALTPGWIPLIHLLVEGCGSEMLGIVDPWLVTDTVSVHY